MNIFAIDPGNIQSAWVSYDPESHALDGFGISSNICMHAVLDAAASKPHRYVCEMIASYGMPVGREVFDTCLWVGRFIEQVKTRTQQDMDLMYRREVKLELCNSAQAKDANVRQALLDRFPASGGGKVPQVGTKAAPGPLYGVSKDVWAALGVAITHSSCI